MSESESDADIVEILEEEEKEEPKKITKTDALQIFLLRAKDFEDLTPEIISIKKYGKYINMSLYLESDILARSIKRWGSLDGLQREKEKRQARKQEKLEKKQQNYKAFTDKRRHELTIALQKVGLQLRDDSKLCDGYIRDNLDSSWTLSGIVEMCEMMNWLHTSTDYQKRLDNFFRTYKNERCNYFEEIHEFDEEKYYVEDRIDDIRSEIINEHGGGKPWKQSNNHTKV